MNLGEFDLTVKLDPKSTAVYGPSDSKNTPAGKKLVLWVTPEPKLRLIGGIKPFIPSYASYRLTGSKLTVDLPDSYTVGSSNERYPSPSPAEFAERLQANLRNRIGLP